MYKIHVFDLDGTLLNSMRMWDKMSYNYVMSLGKLPPEDLAEILDPMTFDEAIVYIAREFEIEGGVDGVVAGMQALLLEEYKYNLQLFSDAIDILEGAAADGLPMVIFSNSPHSLIDPALERTGIDKYFSRVISTEDFGINKSKVQAFQVACDMLGVEPSDCLVHEDSGYAINAALDAGCMVKKYDRYR